MKYFEIEDYFEIVFDIIRELVYDDVQKPFYENEKSGILSLTSVLEAIKNDQYYPTYYSKAAFLLTAISTGHYFSNGNKRLALYSYALFAIINDYTYKSLGINTYKSWFKEYFKSYKFKGDDLGANYTLGIYNYVKAINIKAEQDPQGHHYSFNELKEISENFIRFISIKSK